MSDKPKLYTDEQIERARNIDVKTFLEQTEGYIFTKSGYQLKCIEGHGFPSSLAVDTRTNSIFYNAKTGNQKLSAVDWCTKVRNMSFLDAMKFVLHEEPGGERAEMPVYKPHLESEENPTEKKPFELPKKAENHNTKNIFAYLTKKRCIAEHIVKQCIAEGKIIQDEHNNAVFIGCDPEGNPRYGARRGTGQKPFKRDVSGSDKRFAFSLIGKNTEKIFVAEAAIDVLSLATLTDRKAGKEGTYRNNTYLSTGGAGVDAVIDEFCKQHPEVKDIYICFDNDEAGRNGYEKIKEKYTAMGKNVIYRHPPEQVHDYNDLLVAKVNGSLLPQHTQEAQETAPETEQPSNPEPSAALSFQKEKSTLTVDEDDILKMSAKIQQNLLEDQSFSQSLEHFLNSSEKSSDFLVIGKTSNALAVAGADQKLEVVIAPQTIAKCMAESNERYHGHGLSKAIMQQIPQQLRNPIMVFKGSKNNSLVAITEMKDKENHEIMIAVNLSEAGKRQEVNRVSSAYGKNNMGNYLKAQLEQGNLVACNRKKANEMLQSVGLQLPLEETFISFDNSIAYSMQNVKHSAPGFQKTVESERSEAPQIPLVSQNKATTLETKADFVKINPEYYETLPRDQRYIMQMPQSIMQPVMEQLNAQNIPFSAVGHSNDTVKVTVSTDHTEFLIHAVKQSSTKRVTELTESVSKQPVSLSANPDYYKSLPKEDRFILNLPKENAAILIQRLRESDCKYSSVERTEKGNVGIAVSKSDKNAMIICTQAQKFHQMNLKKAVSTQTDQSAVRQHPQTKKQEQSL